jgi:hypothetical protein
MVTDPADGQIFHVQDLLTAIRSMIPDASRQAHVRWWFRGQSNYSWPLVPGVYRPGFPGASEEDRLNTEQHLTQDFGGRSLNSPGSAGRLHCETPH